MQPHGKRRLSPAERVLSQRDGLAVTLELARRWAALDGTGWKASEPERLDRQ